MIIRRTRSKCKFGKLIWAATHTERTADFGFRTRAKQELDGGWKVTRRRTTEFLLFFTRSLPNEKVTHDRIWNKSFILRREYIEAWRNRHSSGLVSAGEYSRRQKQLYPSTQMAAANKVLAMEILRATINTCQALHAGYTSSSWS